MCGDPQRKERGRGRAGAKEREDEKGGRTEPGETAQRDQFGGKEPGESRLGKRGLRLATSVAQWSVTVASRL